MSLAIFSQLTPLEKEVLAKFLESYPQHRAILEVQLSTATVASREIFDCGFFLNFSGATGQKFEEDMELNQVFADISALKFGAGFLLFIREGFVKLLEGYTYEEMWPDTMKGYRIYTDIQ